MSMEITIVYPSAWANRIEPMSDEQAENIKDNPIILDLLAAEGYTSVDELDALQKTSMIMQFDVMTRLQRHEGGEAAVGARNTVVNEIKNNFPIDLPDAE